MHWVGSMKRKRMTEEERRVANCRSQAAHKARGSLHVGGQSSARRRPEAPPSLIWMPMPTQPWASSSSSSAAACDDVAAVVPSPVVTHFGFTSHIVEVASAAAAAEAATNMPVEAEDASTATEVLLPTGRVESERVREEASTSTSHGAVREVRRRGHDAHRRRSLTLLVECELDDDCVLDELVLISIPMDGKARRAKGVGTLAQDVGPPEHKGPSKVLLQPHLQVVLNLTEAGESNPHPLQVLRRDHQSGQSLLLRVEHLERLGVASEATQLQGGLFTMALLVEQEGAGLPVLRQEVGALLRIDLGHAHVNDAAAQMGRVEETLQSKVMTHLVVLVLRTHDFHHLHHRPSWRRHAHRQQRRRRIHLPRLRLLDRLHHLLYHESVPWTSARDHLKIAFFFRECISVEK